MGGVVGIINDVATTISTQIEDFGEAVVAAGAQILNDFINALAGPHAHDKVIEEWSTQNSYLFTNDAYIDNLYNTDKIFLNSLIKGTNISDEIIDFYKKANTSSDFDLWKALDLQGGHAGGGMVGGFGPNYPHPAWTPLDPFIESNYDLGPPYEELDHILPPVTLRVNNLNLFEGDTSKVPSGQYAGNNNQSNFSWQVALWDNVHDDWGYQRYAPVLNSTTFGYVQENTKKYLKHLGIPDPENLLDDLPYAEHSDVIDSAFLNFRVKFVSGIGNETGNRISNKYLWILAERIYSLYDVPHTLTYTTDDDEVDTVHMYQHITYGDGSTYTMGMSHVSRSLNNSEEHDDYQFDRTLTSSDGYYYYDAHKTLPNGDHSAQTVAQVQSYLNNSSVGTSEVKANWLEIEENGTVVTINGVDSVFPDEIYLSESGITLKMYDSANSEWVDAADQILRVGNLYIKESTTVIKFATVPESVYSNASITYGKSNATSVSYYTMHNVSVVERITDYANDYDDTEYRYITHKLDASNNCVAAPLIMDILEYDLDKFEQHQLVIASANISLHLAHYERIEKTWEEKLRAATLEAIKIGAIIFAVISMGSASSLVVLAETIIITYATSVAVNAIIEHILVPIIVSNFGEDEALVLLAVAAVAIAVYSSESGTAGLDQFPNQVALFTTSVDIMNQMYTLAVVEPGLAEMQQEQEEWTKTDSELTEEEEAFQENYDALFGTESSPSHLLNLQIRAALNPMPASAYAAYHDNILERQFDCYDYEKYNTLNVS